MSKIDSASRYSLAQANQATMLAPLDNPIMADFVSQLDEIDLLAANSRGFIAQPEVADDESFVPKDVLVNVSLWDTVEHLEAFTFAGRHLEMLAQREKWFRPNELPAYVLFWNPKNEVLSMRVIFERFDMLKAKGSNPLAFTFEKSFSVQEMLEYRG